MRDDELPITMTDDLKAQVAADPGMAQALQNLTAAIHQAHYAVQNGQYASMDDALEVLLGSRPELWDLDGNLIEGDAYPGEILEITFTAIEAEDGEEGEEGESD